MPPLTLLVKPVSGSCNLRCSYCFYIDEMENREVKNFGFMSDTTLYQVLKKTLDYADGICTIAFQGGEPTLIGLDFYKKVVSFVSELNRKGCKISYALQTNGYTLDDSWASFFKANNFLIGISLDGLEAIHNSYRNDKLGVGTFSKVIASIDLLKRHMVDFNVLTVINADVAKHASKIYDFYKEQGIFYHQYIECLDPIGEEQGLYNYSLRPKEYAIFLIELFDKWHYDILRAVHIYVQYFENLMIILAGQYPSTCSMLGVCASYFVVESDGSIYPCDFYVLDDWKLGSFLDNDIATVVNNKKLQDFIKYSYDIPIVCKKCKWYSICRNGCRRNCESVAGSGRGVNYFCESYKVFFEYAYPKMQGLLHMFMSECF